MSDSDMAQKTLLLLKERWRLPSEVSPTLFERPSSPIAEAATERGPYDWNAFLTDMPKTMVVRSATNSRPDGATIRHLIAIFGDRIYFLGECLQGDSSRYAVFETDVAGRDWVLYVQRGAMFPVAGAFGEPLPRPNDRHPENAFGRDFFVGFRLRYDPERLEMRHGKTVYTAYRNLLDIERSKKAR